MRTKPLKLFVPCVTALTISLVSSCSTPPESTTITKINRMSASDMEQLSHVGNVWISEQPTEKDLRWMRDNYVSLVIDTRGREEEREIDEQAYVVSLGMKYRLEPLDPDQGFTIRYFDRIRTTLRGRRDVPTLIHGESADRAAAAWLPYRVLDEHVPYPQALAEARIAGLESEAALRLAAQYLMAHGVDVSHESDVTVTSQEAPGETIFSITEGSGGSKTDDDQGESVRD